MTYISDFHKPFKHNLRIYLHNDSPISVLLITIITTSTVLFCLDCFEKAIFFPSLPNLYNIFFSLLQRKISNTIWYYKIWLYLVCFVFLLRGMGKHYSIWNQPQAIPANFKKVFCDRREILKQNLLYALHIRNIKN